MTPIKSLNEIIIGETCTMILPNFSNALNIVVKVSDDYTGLNRPIAYFAYKEQGNKIPTKEELVSKMKNNDLTHDCFALWEHDLTHSLLYKGELKTPKICNPVQVCSLCGSQDVARTKWVNVNTDDIINAYCDSLEWCFGDCKSETNIIDQNDFKPSQS